MKILSIFNQYSERGGEAYAVESICQSLKQIADVTRCDYCSADWTGPTAPNLLQQAAWMLHNPRSLNQLREQHAKSAADAWLVHNVFPVGSAAIYPEARRLGVPIIQYLHNYRPFSVNGYLWANESLAEGGLKLNFWKEIRHGAWQDSRVRTAWFAIVLWITHALGYWQNVNAWIAISDFVRTKFISAGIPAEKIFTLRHFWKPIPRVDCDAGQHYLYLGRLVEPKGVLVVLDAWEILEKEYGAKTPRLVIGGDGPLRNVVQNRARNMRSVEVVGALSGARKMEVLQAARAMVIPSLVWEGLGLVAYEAYDHSRPVLAARSGGLPEIVVSGETGLLHERGNAHQLAHQVMELDANPQKRRAMGTAGRRWLELNTGETAWQSRFLEIARFAQTSSAR